MYKVFYLFFFVLLLSCDQEQKITDLLHGINNIVISSQDTGYDMTDIDFFYHDQKEYAYIISSQASLLNTYPINQNGTLGEKSKSLLLGTGEKAMMPQNIVIHKENTLISFYGTHEIGFMLKKDKKIRYKKLYDEKNILFNAKTPHAFLFINDNNYFVTFTNYYKFATATEKAEVGPGIIAWQEIEANDIKTKSIITLPCQNPTQILAADDNNFWILCTGVWEYKDPIMVSNNAGLVKIKKDGNKLVIEKTILLNNFSPTGVAIASNHLIIPESWNKRIKTISLEDFSENIHINKDYEFKFTTIKKWHDDDIVFLGDVDNGLIAFNLKDGFFPFPFVSPINIGQPPQKIIWREEIAAGEKAGVDFFGATAWVLTMQNKLVSLDFLQVLGR